MNQPQLEKDESCELCGSTIEVEDTEFGLLCPPCLSEQEKAEEEYTNYQEEQEDE